MFNVRILRKERRKFLSCRFVHRVEKDLDQNICEFSEVPGPKSYPIIGSLYKYWPFVGEYDADTLDKNAWLNWCRYGGLVRETPIVNLLHVFEPELMEIIFRQNDRYPSRRSHVAMLHYRMNKKQVYNSGGLLSTNGPEWWRIRSAFQKNFSGPRNAKQYVNITDQVVEEFIQWIKDVNVSSNDDFLPYLNRLNLEVIGAVAFNERFNSFAKDEQLPDSRSSKVIASAFGSNSGIMKLDNGILWKLFKTPLYNNLVKSQEYLEKVSMDILLDRLNYYEEHNSKDKSLLSSFTQQPDVDIKDLIGMMVDILMAAIDTTAYTTSFSLYHIARNPACQQRLFEELDTLLPSKNSEVTETVLSKAVYLKSCVKESLRLNPVSIGVGRILQNDIILKGYKIPEGTVIVTQNMIASRLPQYVRNPLQYKPERWLRGSTDYENIHPFLCLPFGFGSRSCIARRLAEQNICITLMKIIRNFDIQWMGGNLGVKTFLINKPDQPITLQFTPRKI
ncbi:cytochrome P450 302a1, mitochondrial [Colias croceus]|uniref:cytochrome P450 302a1, mitochondrial n=1 Tax=Colias crocea TaxID=72248 RepID=UPI001E27BEDD|nr:cytochrome P450 302a1, mitochondrial [Colias croceus]XP_045493536.1 cytochrome P450 302a1, mitochondrial [Colias croceus]